MAMSAAQNFPPQRSRSVPPPLPAQPSARRAFSSKTPPPLLPPVEPIDLGLLAKLPSLEWRARYLMEGVLSGQHESPRKGYSVEFAEYRAYQPGDELRRVDWRLFGRSDRLYLKRYEEYTQLKAHLVLDTSASMSFAGKTGRLTKLDYARTVLASLTLLMQRQQDAVGLALAGGDLDEYLPPRSSLAHVQMLFGRLNRVQKGAPTALGSALMRFAGLLSKRNLVIIASDFYDDAEALRAGLRRLRHDRHEVVALHVLDPAEVDFDLEESGTFLDLETGAQLALNSGAVRSGYLQQFRAFLAQTEDLFRGHGADYLRLRTDESPIHALAAYLAKRENML